MLTAAGEGGVLTTDDEEHALMADSIRDHGKDKRRAAGSGYSIVRVGNNYRMSELHAAFALAQVHKADSMQRARREHSEYLDAAIPELPGVWRPRPVPDVRIGCSYYPVRFDEERFTVDLGTYSGGPARGGASPAARPGWTSSPPGTRCSERTAARRIFRWRSGSGGSCWCCRCTRT